MYKSLLVCLYLSYAGGWETTNQVFEDTTCPPQLNIIKEFSGSFVTSCDLLVPLDFPNRKDPVPTRYHSMELDGCTPKVSYAETFRAQNRTVASELVLKNLPDELPAQAFACLPASLMRLTLTARRSLTLPLGALASVHVSTLKLTRVRADQVLPGMQRIVVTHSGAAALPRGALDVVDLTVEESNYISLKGRAPRLQQLRVTAPLVELPEAPNLPTLELYQLGSELPPDLLKSVSQLTNFTAERGSFTTLPETFFTYTLKLKTINLNNNQLSYLPSWLFLGMKSLTTLSLKGNLLRAQDLGPLLRLTGLKVLELDRNPIGDLCPTGNSTLTALKELTKLSLTETGLPHLCLDWLHSMSKLQLLDIRHNLIRCFSCTDIRVRRDLRTTSLEIRMENNPIETITRTNSDHDVVVARIAAPVQHLDVNG